MASFFICAALAIATARCYADDAPRSGLRAAYDMSAAIERIRPSVISFSVTKKEEMLSPWQRVAVLVLGEAHFETWRHFWYQEILHSPLPAPQHVMKVGTGIVIDTQGLILTNEHLIADATDIWATTHDGLRYRAQVQAMDVGLDLAIVAIGTKDLHVPTFANSDEVYVGQPVMIIGNALGFSNTASQGIISGKERNVTDEFGRIFENVFQTDAAMNFGHSGGPLVDAEGRVIGMNLAIVPHGQNVSFALPSNSFVGVLNELLRRGKVERGWIGCQVAAVRRADTSELYVQGIHPNSPAASLNLVSGDRIMDINGFQPATNYEFYKYVRTQKIGDEVTLRILRGQDILVKTARVASFPATKAHLAAYQTPRVLGWFDQLLTETRWMVLLLSLFSVWFALRMRRYVLSMNAQTRRARRRGSRRMGSRRKGERRKGERRKTLSIVRAELERRRLSDRRKTERRAEDRRRRSARRG